MPTTPNKAVDVIRKINAGSEYEISARYLHTEDNLHDYTVEDLLNLVGAGIQLIVDEKHSSKDEPVTAPSADTLGKIYLVNDPASLVGAHVEFITVKGETDSYSWEKIGTTTADLSDYAKTGIKTSSSNGSHSHTVSAKVAVPTVAKIGKKLSAKITDVEISAPTSSAATGFNADGLDDEVLGSATTFATDVKPTLKNIEATATGTAVSTTSATVLKGLGKATTAKAVTGFNDDAGTDEVVTSFNADAPSSKFLTTGTTVSASGGAVTTKHIKATATGTAVSTTPASVVGSINPTTQKMVTTSIKGVSGTTSASKVSITPGSKADLKMKVSAEGVLSFEFTANDPTIVTDKPVTVATANSIATTVATGSISSSGSGSSVVTSVPTTPASVLKSASISAQPTITISEGTASDFEVVTGVSKVTASINHVTGNALTGMPTPITATVINAMPTTKTDTFVKNYAPTTESVVKTVSVSAQPTIDLSYTDVATDKTVAAMTDVTVGVTHNADDNVTAITKVPTLATSKFVTGVTVSAQPTITLEDTGSTGIDFIQAVTIGSEDRPIKEVSVSTTGAHTHTTSI